MKNLSAVIRVCIITMTTIRCTSISNRTITPIILIFNGLEPTHESVSTKKRVTDSNSVTLFSLKKITRFTRLLQEKVQVGLSETNRLVSRLRKGRERTSDAFWNQLLLTNRPKIPHFLKSLCNIQAFRLKLDEK